MELKGLSYLGSKRGATGGHTFRAINPQTGAPLDPVFHSASRAEVDAVVQLAAEAFETYARTSGKERAAFLRRCADALDKHKEEIAQRAHLETALPMARLTGEVARTTGQLRLFAALVEDGSWVDARIDPAIPDRKPLPRVDLRSMLRPLGPVVVFGSSNFPIAFSVAGGDTASALAAGCPVIVKAHQAHPGTGEMIAGLMTESVAAAGLPPGTFSALFGPGSDVGATLVQHPLVRAVGFTGSLGGGRALMDLCANRPQPIPCFTEMSSGNPVFILPSALRKGTAELAKNLYASFTLGAGQFCTKPGIVFVPEAPESPSFLEELCALVEQSQPFTLLTAGIAKSYASATAARAQQIPLAAAAAAASSTASTHACNAQVFKVCLDQLIGEPELGDEIFGPYTLLVHCETTADYLRAARALEGHLTATILGDEEDLAFHRELVQTLERKAGRLIVNGFPTGVEVTHAMVHGGPYPATSDSRFTSVGTQAIYRFVRPVCFQNFPQSQLPPELQDSNPLGIRRLRDGKPE